MRVIRIGTRGSILAVAQAEIVAETVRRTWPDIMTELVKITTSGDKNMTPFSSDPSGIKGMFTLELGRALMNHEIDFAVHSLKDLPANISPGLPVVAYSRRGDPKDALVGSAGVIGSSSLRRRLQLARLFPKSRIVPVRGNITTRLRRLDEGEYSGLALSVAGLERLGEARRIARVFSVDEVMPAPGQGILACQGRAGEDYSYLDCVNDDDARDCALAERSFSRAIGGGCNVPLGAYAEADGGTLTVKGLYVDGGRFRKGMVSGSRRDAESLGERLAEEVMS
ncbi:MAG: hydroxymethylbilane synthase [Synergistaceae bacterium]|nr:hydroxymethylbilane synthase [Synergistaceae bacterium]